MTTPPTPADIAKQTDQPAEQADEHVERDASSTDADNGQQNGTSDADRKDEDPRNREARERRQQVEDLTAERDNLAAQLDAMRRAEILRLADLAKPEILLMNADPADFVADDGTVDPDKVAAAVDAAVETYGVARRPAPEPHRIGFILEGRSDQSPASSADPFVRAASNMTSPAY